MTRTTAYISIGNSDDKLTQVRWHQFYVETNVAIRRSVEANSDAVHGAWVSEPASAWQNACWCVRDLAGLRRAVEVQAGRAGRRLRPGLDCLDRGEVAVVPWRDYGGGGR